MKYIILGWAKGANMPSPIGDTTSVDRTIVFQHPDDAKDWLEKHILNTTYWTLKHYDYYLLPIDSTIIDNNYYPFGLKQYKLPEVGGWS